MLKTQLPPFVQLKNMFKDYAKGMNIPMPDRDAHRIAQGFLLSNACERAEDENYFLSYSDDTGEDAVKNALISLLRKYGSLRGPRHG